MTEAEWLSSTYPRAMLDALRDSARRLVLIHADEIRKPLASKRKLRLFACACCRLMWHLLTDMASREAVEVAEQYADGQAKRCDLRAAYVDARRASRAAFHAADDAGMEAKEKANKVREEKYDGNYWPMRAREDARDARIDAWEAWEQAVAAGTAWYAARGDAWVVARNAANEAWDSMLAFNYLHNLFYACFETASGAEAEESDARKAATDTNAALLRDIFGNPWRRYAWADIHDCSELCKELQLLNPCWRTWNDRKVPLLAQAAYEERHLPSGTLDNTRLAILADALEEAGCTDNDILDHCRQQGVHVRGCWVVDLLLGKS